MRRFLAFVAVLLAVACLQDDVWVDDLEVVVDGRRLRGWVQQERAEDGNTGPVGCDTPGGCSTCDGGDACDPNVLAVFTGSGTHRFEVVSVTEDQRESTEVFVWRDADEDGVLSCEEEARRVPVVWTRGEPTRLEFVAEEIPWNVAGDVTCACGWAADVIARRDPAP